MCVLCETYGIDLDAPDPERAVQKHRLMDMLRDIKHAHPYHYDVGPLANEVRRWYDLDAEERQHGKK